MLAGAAGGAFALLNRVRPWHRLPCAAVLLNLSLLRRRLRRHNLIDTDVPDARRSQVRVPPGGPACPTSAGCAATTNGEHNDLSAPADGCGRRPLRPQHAGCAGPPAGPDPIAVSERLLARETFLPAESLNVLAAAWIQFQVHDWVNRARHPLGVRSIEVPITDGRPWRNTVDGPQENVMRIAADDGDGNAVSHWWDGSEVYGVTVGEVATRAARARRRPAAARSTATCRSTTPADRAPGSATAGGSA